ncbi:MAG: hypothetical protein P8Y49_07225 [Sulfurovaceae bacterium]|jgi:hypothetical protein
MIEEAITYHLVTIEILLATMIFNLTVSQLVKEPFAKIIRSGYFLFWAMVSMVIFAGTVLFLIAASSFDVRVFVMVLGIVVIGIIEFKRVRANTMLWMQEKSIKKSSLLSITIEITFLLAIYFWATLVR